LTKLIELEAYYGESTGFLISVDRRLITQIREIGAFTFPDHFLKQGIVIDHHYQFDRSVNHHEILCAHVGTAIIIQPTRNDEGSVFLVDLLDELDASETP